MNDSDQANLMQAWPVLLVVFASWLGWSLVAAPIPNVNEPHYLAKAKHYWNNEWCPGDFFLESSNTHAVFYQTVGLLTLRCSLWQTALIGRIAGFLLLAAGWTALVRQLTTDRWAPVWTAWLYLLIVCLTEFSGEWIIGGIEAKVFSYAFLFWSLAELFSGRMIRSGCALGLAISFHPIVGIWGLAAILFAAVATYCGQKSRAASWRSQLLFGVSVLVLSLPGLVPALGMLGQGTSLERLQGTWLQVFYRLSHHLDPMDFQPSGYAAYAGLFLVCLGLERDSRADANRFWFWLILGTAGIGLMGFLAGIGPRPNSTEMWGWEWRMHVLKFYPFRMIDGLLPVAVSIAIVRRMSTPASVGAQPTDDSPQSAARRNFAGGSRVAWIASGLCFAGTFLTPLVTNNPSRLTGELETAWLETCAFIQGKTPHDALVLTPNESWAFHWYAERAEYVAFKNCPQDPAGIVEWNRRLGFLKDWASDHYSGGYTREELVDLRRTTGITHLIADRLGPIRIPTLYENAYFRVYAIPTEAGLQTGTRTD